MKLSETCSCGAQWSVDEDFHNAKFIYEKLDEWRRLHPCGNVAAPPDAAPRGFQQCKDCAWDICWQSKTCRLSAPPDAAPPCSPLCGATKAYGRFVKWWQHEAQCPARVAPPDAAPRKWRDVPQDAKGYPPPDAAPQRCPVCEGIDAPGLVHNPKSPYCSAAPQEGQS